MCACSPLAGGSQEAITNSPKCPWHLPVAIARLSHRTGEQSHHEGHGPHLHLIPRPECSRPSSCPGEEWGRISWDWGVFLGNILLRPLKAEEWTCPSQKVEMAQCLWILSSCISCEFRVQMFAAFVCCLLVTYCLTSLWYILTIVVYATWLYSFYIV